MVVVPPLEIMLPLGLALRRITVQLTREGSQTPSVKSARLMAPSDLSARALFITKDGYSSSQLFLASAVDREHLLLAADESFPKRAAARYPVVTEDVVFNIDLTDGNGGGAGGSPASLAARVRVDRFDVAREVLAVERQIDGVWRVAGSLRTADGSLDLRVTGGEVYAMAIDDYGTVFQSDLSVAVGSTIRPSQYSGWLYRITEPGTLPAAEPQWWAAEGDNAARLLGTARAIAVRYYQPLAHGPVPVEVL